LCVHSRAAPKRHHIGLAVPPARHVPSPWFLTTTTAYSTQQLRAYCISVPTRGSLRFRSLHPARLERTRLTQSEEHFPATRFHTPRRIPLTGSRTASLRPLPSCRYDLRSRHRDAHRSTHHTARTPCRPPEIPLTRLRRAMTTPKCSLPAAGSRPAMPQRRPTPGRESKPLHQQPEIPFSSRVPEPRRRCRLLYAGTCALPLMRPGTPTRPDRHLAPEGAGRCRHGLAEATPSRHRGTGQADPRRTSLTG
jgi:hypothetical protein